MKKTFILCIVSALLGGLVAIALRDLPKTETRSEARESVPWKPPKPGSVPTGRIDPNAPPPAGYEDLTPEERVGVAVYENTNRSVVNITTESVQTDRMFMFERISEGEGSGSIIDRQGHVLTNFHVVDRARQVHVTLFNQKTYEAKLVGMDPETDIAVLKIDASREELFPVALGTSTRLLVGQRVFAIGNPFGLERTLTTGVISSLNRSLPRRGRRGTIKSIIQIDAAINPGNSGGPLLDSQSRMIGMNTAIASRTGESAGVGFAISVNTILRVVPQLIEDGHVLRGDIGITRVYETDSGLRIAALAPDGAAKRAGLRGFKIVRHRKRQGQYVYEYQTIDRSAADLIVAVDGKPIRSADELLDVVENKKPGEQVTVTVIRDGKKSNVTVRLDADE